MTGGRRPGDTKKIESIRLNLRGSSSFVKNLLCYFCFLYYLAIASLHSISTFRRVAANDLAKDEWVRDANGTLWHSSVFLDHEPLLDPSADIAIVERDRVLGRAVVTRVAREDFPRPLVEAVLVLGGNTVADLELGGLCR